MQHHLTALLAASLLAGCTGDDTPPVTPTRSVATMRLEETEPKPGGLIPGVVSPYRENSLSFEVSGRITKLLDVGEDVDGDRLNELGKVVAPGTIVAELDPAPYERALTQAEKRLASGRAQLAALSAQLEKVLPSRVASARATAAAAELSISYAESDVSSLTSAADLARTTLERNEGLLPTGAVSDIAVRESKNDLETKQAKLNQSRTLVTTRRREHEAAIAAVAEAEGAIALQAASVDAQRAGIGELEQQLLDVKSDLDNCVLRAPFGGRITALHVGEGSVVQAGSPIASLTMMTPIEVELTVSSTLEKQLVLGAGAVVYPMDGANAEMDRGLPATLFQKPGIANSRSSTFTVGLITANRRSVSHPSDADVPTSPFLAPVLQNPLDLPGNDSIYTLAEGLGGSGSDIYVLRVSGIQQGARTAASLTKRLTATRVPVRRGASTLQFAGLTLVELQPNESLSPSDLLVGLPTPAHETGFRVIDNRWLLRPGDLVQVALDRPSQDKGFYVPVQSIQEINGETFVFIVRGGRASRVAVEVADSAGERRRVESPELTGELSLVTAGAHYLRDGDPVRVTGNEGGLIR